MKETWPAYALLSCTVTRRSVDTRARGSTGHRAGQNLLMVFAQANLMMQVERGMYSLVDGSVVLVPRGAQYGFAHGSQCRYTCLSFTLSGARGAPLVEGMLTKLPPLLHLEDGPARRSIQAQMDALYAHLHGGSAIFDGYADAYAQASVIRLLLEVHAQQMLAERQPTAEPNRRLAERIAGFVDENLPSQLSLSVLEQTFFLSRYHLCRIFRQEMRMTIFAYVRRQRARKASELLAASNMPVTAVAYAVGFGNLQSFYTAFEKEYGRTPSQYRRQEHRAAAEPGLPDMIQNNGREHA